MEHEARGWVEFAVLGSEIRAYSSTAKAGRSTDATLVIRDELEKHENAAEHYASVRPTIAAGGQMIDLSTIDKSVADSHFQSRIDRIRVGESKSLLVFLGWKERPVREQGVSLEEWYEVEKQEHTPFEMECEYPETLEEALKPTSTRGWFETYALDRLESNLTSPIGNVEGINTFNGMIRIFEYPVVGNKYCIFTDPSDGIEDPHCTVVINRLTGKQVAESHGKVKADICAQVHDSLVRYYFNAFNSYELNAYAGGKFDESIVNLETPSRCPFISPEGQLKLDKNNIPHKWGWWTSPQLKKKIIRGLEEAIRKNQISVGMKETVDEFRNYIIIEGVGDPEPRKNWHDDRVMAWAGVWELTKHYPASGEIKSFRPAVRR